MKKYLLILVLAAGQLCAAQPDFSRFPNPEFAKMIYERPWMANLNACPYEMAVQPEALTKAPRGYKPFYISHYGRHGTRSGLPCSARRSIAASPTGCTKTSAGYSAAAAATSA